MRARKVRKINRRIQEKYNRLLNDPDRSKILAIHALLAHDDGETYTEQEYQKAIAFLEERIATDGDTSDGFRAKAVQWCKTRSRSCATTK